MFGKDKMIKRFLKSKKITEKDMLYVGDEQRDVAACKKAGVNVIWVSWGYDVIETVKKMHLILWFIRRWKLCK